MKFNFIVSLLIVFVMCLSVGYVYKHAFKRLHNKWIPIVLIIVGGVAMCILVNKFDIVTAIKGISGAGLATITHEAVKQQKKNPKSGGVYSKSNEEIHEAQEVE